MTEFKTGDIVRITKGEADKPGHRVEVRTVTEDSGFCQSESPEVNFHRLRTFENAGWKIELIERPAPQLPTKPNTLGWALIAGTRYLARLGTGGVMWELYDGGGDLIETAPASSMPDFEEAVLIPKTLADRVMEWAGDEGGKWYAGGILERIAGHLKGQDDE